MEPIALSNAADVAGFFERVAIWIGGSDEAKAALLVLALTPVLRLFWLGTSSAYQRFIEWLARRTVRCRITLGPLPPPPQRCAGLPTEVPIQCLIIRYGSDEYLEKLASDRERFEGRLRLEILRSKLRLDPDTRTYSGVMRLKAHRRLVTQFKLFFEVEGDEEADCYVELLRQMADVADVSTSRYGPRPKVWFLLKRYAITGRNNLYFPI